jgi:predicted Fe-S protein YdhL (DUF1289 family)
MSIPVTQTQSSCEYCDENYTVGYDAQYCSEECYHKQQGQNLLNNIKYDHRFCFGCMRQLKEVSRPPADKPDCVVGFQYITPNGTHGQKTINSVQYHDVVSTGTICNGCGTTDHRDEFYSDENVKERAKRLFSILNLTGREGQHDKTIDVEAFIEAWNNSKHWAYSVGKAIA